MSTGPATNDSNELYEESSRQVGLLWPSKLEPAGRSASELRQGKLRAHIPRRDSEECRHRCRRLLEQSTAKIQRRWRRCSGGRNCRVNMLAYKQNDDEDWLQLAAAQPAARALVNATPTGETRSDHLTAHTQINPCCQCLWGEMMMKICTSKDQFTFSSVCVCV